MAIVQRPRWLPVPRSLGIRADDLDIGVTFATIADAEANAQLLAMRSYRRVEIFDRETGNVEKQLRMP